MTLSSANDWDVSDWSSLKCFFLQLSSVPILKTKLHPKPFCTFAGTCRSQQPHGEGVPRQQKGQSVWHTILQVNNLDMVSQLSLIWSERILFNKEMLYAVQTAGTVLGIRSWKLHTIRRIFSRPLPPSPWIAIGIVCFTASLLALDDFHPPQQTSARSDTASNATHLMKVKPFKQVFWMCKHRFFGPNFKMNDRVVHFLVHEYFLSSFSSQFHSYWHFQLVYHYTGSVLVTVHTRSESWEQLESTFLVVVEGLIFDNYKDWRFRLWWWSLASFEETKLAPKIQLEHLLVSITNQAIRTKDLAQAALTWGTA